MLQLLDGSLNVTHRSSVEGMLVYVPKFELLFHRAYHMPVCAQSGWFKFNLMLGIAIVNPTFLKAIQQYLLLGSVARYTSSASLTIFGTERLGTCMEIDMKGTRGLDAFLSQGLNLDSNPSILAVERVGLVAGAVKIDHRSSSSVPRFAGSVRTEFRHVLENIANTTAQNQIIGETGGHGELDIHEAHAVAIWKDKHPETNDRDAGISEVNIQSRETIEHLERALTEAEWDLAEYC
ncbi:hypothetical protein B0H19DRAFT_1069363 [Mycena capillaripes]|nr:hypothetical protein B0H19DRAFT_1069363 [Mycena capillaripes]